MAGLPGEDEGVPTESCAAALFGESHCIATDSGAEGCRERTSAHKGATVTLEAKLSCGFREGFNLLTNFQRETECQTYPGAARGM